MPRELLFDQMNAVVLEDARAEGGKVLENPKSTCVMWVCIAMGITCAAQCDRLAIALGNTHSR